MDFEPYGFSGNLFVKLTAVDSDGVMSHDPQSILLLSASSMPDNRLK